MWKKRQKIIWASNLSSWLLLSSNVQHIHHVLMLFCICFYLRWPGQVLGIWRVAHHSAMPGMCHLGCILGADWHISRTGMSITRGVILTILTPDECHHVSNHRQLDFVFNSLFRPITKNSTLMPCKGNPAIFGTFPSQKASNKESVANAWRHHRSFIKGRFYWIRIYHMCALLFLAVIISSAKILRWISPVILKKYPISLQLHKFRQLRSHTRDDVPVLDEFGGKIVRNFRPLQERGHRTVRTMQHVFETAKDYDEQFHKQGLFTTHKEIRCQFNRQGISIDQPGGCKWKSMQYRYSSVHERGCTNVSVLRLGVSMHTGILILQIYLLVTGEVSIRISSYML